MCVCDEEQPQRSRRERRKAFHGERDGQRIQEVTGKRGRGWEREGKIKNPLASGLFGTHFHTGSICLCYVSEQRQIRAEHLNT